MLPFFLVSQLVVALLLVTTVAGTAWRLLVVGRVDFERILAAYRRDRRVIAALAGTQLAPLVATQQDDSEVAVIEATHSIRAAAGRGLGLIRVLGLLSGAVSFAALASSMAWVGADHGLRSLDAGAIQAEASLAGAVAIAIGFGGSSFAIAARVTLGRYRAELLRALRSLTARSSDPQIDQA